MKFVAVTSCPTGIAHTYMAAEALEQAAAEAGDEMHVETQGSAGADPLDQSVIDEADAVIFAADVEVRGRERFAGKPLVQSGVKRAIGGAAQMLDEARAAAAAAPSGGAADGSTAAGAAGAGAASAGGGGLATKVDSGAGFGSRLRQWLMTGVSYVIPFVAAGGLLIALSFALGGYQIVDAPSVTEGFSWGSLQSWAALMFQIGGIAFGFLVPILAGFIAFAMADRPALVPGIVGGAIATQVPSEDAPAGFLGGLVAGLLAGAVVLLIRRVKVPRAVAGIMPVVVIPLLATLVVGFLMFVVLGPPIGALTAGLTSWLNGLSGANRVLLGVLLGLMMAFDMGGPINKTAYAFAVAGLSTQTDTSFQIMAAGMTPPLGMALATVIRKRLFSNVEQENGKAAWVLGASFITEGAIPFAAGDPLRVIPSLMAGSAVTGALSMAFGATSRAPHGGIFVVPLIGNPLLYLVAIVIGTVVTAALVVTLKSLRRTPEDAADEVPATRAATAA